MDLHILLSPPVAFLVFMLVGLGIYGLGRLMAGEVVPESGKSEPYACGEPFKAEHVRFGYAKFYVAALFFTLMHVAALVIATVPTGVNAFKALIYLGAIAVSIALLYVDFD
jgi:NADH:ubiquinone oxidoreductase subunit 3 (subunit A)